MVSTEAGPTNRNSEADKRLSAEPDPLIRDSDGAKMLDCSVATWWRRVADGTIPLPIKIGGMSRWPQSEIVGVVEQAKAQRDALIADRLAARDGVEPAGTESPDAEAATLKVIEQQGSDEDGDDAEDDADDPPCPRCQVSDCEGSS